MEKHTLNELNNLSREELITIVLSMQGQHDGSMSILWAQKVELFSQHNICRENYFLGC